MSEREMSGQRKSRQILNLEQQKATTVIGKMFVKTFSVRLPIFLDDLHANSVLVPLLSRVPTSVRNTFALQFKNIYKFLKFLHDVLIELLISL